MKLAFLIVTLFVSTVSFGQSQPEERNILTCTNEKETVDGQLVLKDVDTPPVYFAGQSELYKAISKEVKWPKQSDHTSMYIRMYLSFIVDTTGKLRNFCVFRRDNYEIHAAFEEEAIRVFKAIGDWTPGEHEGKKVPVRIIYPISIHYKN